MMLVSKRLSSETQMYRRALLQKGRFVLNVKLALPKKETITATHAPNAFAR